MDWMAKKENMQHATWEWIAMELKRTISRRFNNKDQDEIVASHCLEKTKPDKKVSKTPRQHMAILW